MGHRTVDTQMCMGKSVIPRGEVNEVVPRLYKKSRLDLLVPSVVLVV